MNTESLNTIEAQIQALDSRKDWLRIGGLLYTIDSQKIYRQDRFSSFKEWVRSGNLRRRFSERVIYRMRDAYKTFCVGNGCQVEYFDNFVIAKADSLIPVFHLVSHEDRRLLIEYAKRCTVGQLSNWSKQAKSTASITSDDIRELGQLHERSERDICKRILRDYPHLLSGDSLLGEFKLFDGEWKLGNEGDTLDLVGRNKKKDLLVLIEVEKDPVDSQAVGQALVYLNFALEAQETTGVLTYRKGTTAIKTRSENIGGMAIRTGLVGDTFTQSSYYAGKGTDLIYYRVSRDFERRLSSISMRDASPESWRNFTRRSL